MQEAGRERRQRRLRSFEDRSARTRRKVWLLFLALAAFVTAYQIVSQLRESSPPPIPLVVRAIGENEQPLAGVEMSFYRRGRIPVEPVYRARTDETGRIVLPAEEATGELYCLCRSPDGVLSQGYVIQGDRRPEVVEFAAPEPIRGLVMDAKGMPLPGVTVDAHFGDQRAPSLATARTDKNGEFRFDSLSGSLSFLFVRARLDGHAEQEIEWVRADGTKLEFELPRAASLRIRVLLPGGGPAADVPVRVKMRPELDSRTDAQGEVLFSGLDPEVALFLRIVHPTLTYRLGSLAPREEAAIIRLEEPAVLEGRVCYANGSGVRDVEVRHKYGPRGWVRTQSDRRGRFRLGDLPAGKVEIHYETSEGVIGRFTASVGPGETRKGFVFHLGS